MSILYLDTLVAQTPHFKVCFVILDCLCHRVENGIFFIAGIATENDNVLFIYWGCRNESPLAET